MRRVLPAAVVGSLFVVVAGLYAVGNVTAYEHILRTWGVDPFRSPFLDLDGVISAARCFHDGVDVITANPCDPLRRPHNYGPVWLALGWLPVTEAWLVPAGLILSVVFAASLLLLPPGRSAVATTVIMLGAASSAVAFALERGNNDLVVFVLVVIGATLACRTASVRLTGYAAFLLAGLLKFYPMTLMALVTRERPRRFFAVAAAIAAVLVVVIVTMGHDYSRSTKLIPPGNLFGDGFGSAVLPKGLARLNEWPDTTAYWIRVALIAVSASAGWWLGLRPALTAAFDRLSELERTTLLAGALLVVGCYFNAYNAGYRAIFLVLTLPALTALVRAGAGWPFTLATCAALTLLWAQGWRNWVSELIPGRPVVVGAWGTREVLWWWMITVLIALVVGLLRHSEMGRRAFDRAWRA